MPPPRTIAIVDDEPNILASLRSAFERAGYRVRTYARSSEALDALTEEPADLTILDGHNPPLHGAGLFKLLRERMAMPIVVLAADTDRVKAELNAAGLEAEDYIDKPFMPHRVVARVDAILARGGG